MPGTVQIAVHVLIYLILTPTLGGRYLYFSHSVGEKTEAQRVKKFAQGNKDGVQQGLELC